MLTSFALIFLVGMILGELFHKFKLPRLLGMIVTGIVLGPHGLNLIDDSVMNVAADLRKLALIIILSRAGLVLKLDDLKKVGRPAIMMCFIPACFEIVGVTLIAPVLFGISYLEAAVMGAALAAVSPAVVVPRMVNLIDRGYGVKKGIPQMILAGASADDVFVIVLFTTFVGLVAHNEAGVSVMNFLNVPISIVTGLGFGILMGYLLNKFWKHKHMRDSKKVVMLLGLSFVLVAIEDWLSGYVAFSGLLAVMSMGASILNFYPNLADRLSEKYSKLWVGAELILFVLVGTAVDIKYTLAAGIGVIVVLVVGLLFRMSGVHSCMIKTNLNVKERWFCALAYTPKATVQAAIGAIPLSMGLPCGKLVLTVSVMSILLTAPFGAITIDATYKKFLSRDK